MQSKIKKSNIEKADLHPVGLVADYCPSYIPRNNSVPLRTQLQHCLVWFFYKHHKPRNWEKSYLPMYILSNRHSKLNPSYRIWWPMNQCQLLLTKFQSNYRFWKNLLACPICSLWIAIWHKDLAGDTPGRNPGDLEKPLYSALVLWQPNSANPWTQQETIPSATPKILKGLMVSSSPSQPRFVSSPAVTGTLGRTLMSAVQKIRKELYTQLQPLQP